MIKKALEMAFITEAFSGGHFFFIQKKKIFTQGVNTEGAFKTTLKFYPGRLNLMYNRTGITQYPMRNFYCLKVFISPDCPIISRY